MDIILTLLIVILIIMFVVIFIKVKNIERSIEYIIDSSDFPNLKAEHFKTRVTDLKQEAQNIIDVGYGDLERTNELIKILSSMNDDTEAIKLSEQLERIKNKKINIFNTR